MSQRTAAFFQAIFDLSSSIVLFLASFLALLLHGLRQVLTRRIPVKLTINEKNSALVSEHSTTTIFEMIKERCPSLYGPQATFRPTWWLPGGDLQTIWCVVAEMFYRDSIPYTRQLLRLPDGGTISLDVYPPFEGPDDDTPILFVLHGLTGTTQESYTRATVKDITRSKVETGTGFRVVALNFRGCDVDSPVTTPRLYHAGETDDTRSALLWLTQTYPKAPLYGCGFSMGASTLACYLGQEGDKTPLKGAICVSNPWDWVTATDHIENGGFLNRYIYGPILADALLTMFKNSRYAFEIDKRLNIKDIYSRRYVTIRWFDDRVTAPQFGFKDAMDYYDKASSSRYVHKIRVPHLSIQSADDPMVALKNLPTDDVAESDHVVMATTAVGGHVAWFTTREDRWFTTPIREFIEAIHSVCGQSLSNFYWTLIVHALVGSYTTTYARCTADRCQRSRSVPQFA
ncbi:hypothetical protein BS47DRAFT_1286828 [Hydnum rufescens UP504]|uniref:AB hydrolase-1 domain-containing protein n=1 Tax=Hydnum rufescens UP504 TaxID=1448309 RepID=A0A9P6E266_9AGAM|nr:hypothetical protein BS47DRAFT_1286828 [Hydnum rufescens UP504]